MYLKNEERLDVYPGSFYFPFVTVKLKHFLLTSFKYKMLQSVMKGPMVMVVTRTVVVTVVMIFPVTSCLVNVTGDVILDTQTLTVAKVYLYIPNIMIHLYNSMISRLML